MFFDKVEKEQKEYYEKLLKIVGSLSNLFTDSSTPYLYYRVAENLFCKSFNALNLARSDCSVDASKNSTGFGLKTFLFNNGNTYQKIAEFNKDSYLYKDLKNKELIEEISSLRNKRIKSTKRIHNLDNMIYHCVLRNTNKFSIYEEEIEEINIENIKNIKENKNSIHFEDNKNEYSFLVTKSTLTKKFKTNRDKIIHSFDVSILDDPFTLLENLDLFKITKPFDHIKDTIYLPLYSDKSKEVQVKSGLNTWNAKSRNGKQRNFNEVYIPIPLPFIRKFFPKFFPSREIPFNLNLPNRKKLSVKVCQDDGKALTSNPNEDLGKWILRDVLNLGEGELLTKEKLDTLGIDSVRIDKIDDLNFDINFSKVNSYEDFKLSKEENL